MYSQWDRGRARANTYRAEIPIGRPASFLSSYVPRSVMGLAGRTIGLAHPRSALFFGCLREAHKKRPAATLWTMRVTTGRRSRNLGGLRALLCGGGLNLR